MIMYDRRLNRYVIDGPDGADEQEREARQLSYAWRRRSRTDEHAATITLARRADWPERCPRCDSPDPARHPAVQYEGEVSICSDTWHTRSGDLLLVMDSTQDRRRLYALDGAELPHGLDFEEVAVGDEHVTADQLLRIERDHDLVLPPDARGWDLERLWVEP